MNHARIAAEALRYRLSSVRGPLIADSDLDLDRMAGATIAAGDPIVDGAIRRIASAWARAGLDPEHLCQPWDCPAARTLFTEQPDLVDALDDILRAATRAQAA